MNRYLFWISLMAVSLVSMTLMSSAENQIPSVVTDAIKQQHENCPKTRDSIDGFYLFNCDCYLSELDTLVQHQMSDMTATMDVKKCLDIPNITKVITATCEQMNASQRASKPMNLIQYDCHCYSNYFIDKIKDDNFKLGLFQGEKRYAKDVLNSDNFVKARCKL